MTIESLLTRVFRHEEINGGHRCPTYLHRWTLFQPRRPKWFWRGFGIYIHKFVGDDWSRDLHDHPKRFISVGLKGGYVEYTPGQPEAGRWEVARDDSGVMVRVRWSIPDADGRYLKVRHYEATRFGVHACELQAETFNKYGITPADCHAFYAEIVRDFPLMRAGAPVPQEFCAPWVRTFPADHVHRITLRPDRRPCWTLVIVLAHVREWGFWHLDRFIPWRTYVAADSAIADEMRSCQ